MTKKSERELLALVLVYIVCTCMYNIYFVLYNLLMLRGSTVLTKGRGGGNVIIPAFFFFNIYHIYIYIYIYVTNCRVLVTFLKLRRSLHIVWAVII